MFSRALHAEWIKIRSTRTTAALLATVWISSLADAALVGIMSRSFEHPGADTVLFAFAVVGLPVSAVQGVLLVSTEFDTGTVNSTLLLFPRRGVVAAAKAVVLTAVTAASALAVVVVSAGLAAAASRGADAEHRVSFGSSAFHHALWAAPATAVLVALLGAAAAALLRTGVAAVAWLLGWWFVVENGLVRTIPAAGRTLGPYLPFGNAHYAVLGVGPTQFHWSAAAAVGYLALWTGLAAAAAAKALQNDP